MATGGSNDGANNSVNTLTCAICLEKYCRPKMLACYHSFCQQCLQDLVGTSSSFPCPSCRKITILSPGGVSALQANFYTKDGTDKNSSSPCPHLFDLTQVQNEQTQVQHELTKELPTFSVNHSNTTVNPLQLRAFIGVVEPTDPALCVQESVTGEGGDSTGTSHESPSASSCASIKVKKAPILIAMSLECGLWLHATCPISRGRVWIYYRSHPWNFHLSLFDAQGRMLVDTGKIELYSSIVTMDDENALLFNSSDSHGLMISSDGQTSSVSLGFDFHMSIIRSDMRCGHLYISRGGSVHYGKVTLSGDQVTYSQDRVVFNEIPEDCWLLHVSADEQYFAFYTDREVRVYTKNNLGVPQLLSSYNTKYGVNSACFCKIDERELLLVTVREDNKVHVVDHKDGGRFVCYLDTGTVDVVRPSHLYTDYDKHVWIECFNSGVVVAHLSADCDCEDDLHTE